MADCTKGILELSPADNYTCFIEADIWNNIGTNSQHMWLDVIAITNGDWLGIFLGVVLIPAELLSFVLPLVFITQLANTSAETGRCG